MRGETETTTGLSRLPMLARGLAAGLAMLIACGASAADGDTLRIGSKRFTESYILGEILTQSVNQRASPDANQASTAQVKAEHRQGLGNTAIVLGALQAGDIDVYAEYLGTINSEILKHPAPTNLEQMRRELAALGLGLAVPLGFNNSYALAMRSGGDAKAPVIRRLGELAQHPELKFGLSHEFIGREDGWPGLARRYALAQRPSGLDHGIAYEALAAHQVDVIDIYSTDAKIAKYQLRVLTDDQGYFPRYDAMLLYRLDLVQRFPAAWRALQTLEGRITETDMIAMNAAVEIDGASFATAAKNWLANHAAATSQGAAAASKLANAAASTPGIAADSAPGIAPDIATAKAASPATAHAGLISKLFDDNLWRLTRQHLLLVLVSVALACAFGIPLGLLAAFWPRLRQTVLALVGVLQTVPSLALLAMLIPLLGMIGTVPALIALFVYALLPIVRNTCIGILQVPDGLRMAAMALGLQRRDRLLQIDLPLALPVILAGVKTAAVMSVGTATIAAFIGAGGYGERITIGLALNDNDMLLAGAIPAAVLALLTQAMFELIERWATPGRRMQRG